MISPRPPTLQALTPLVLAAKAGTRMRPCAATGLHERRVKWPGIVRAL